MDRLLDDSLEKEGRINNLSAPKKIGLVLGFFAFMSVSLISLTSGIRYIDRKYHPLEKFDRAVSYAMGENYEEGITQRKKECVDSFFKMYDLNDDGIIRREEYQKYVNKLFERK